MNHPPAAAAQRIVEEIDQLRRELAVRQTGERPAPASVVYAYRELLARQYDRLDRLNTQ